MENNGGIMAYLTIWSYMLLAIYFLSSAVIAVYHHCKGQGRHRHHNTVDNVTLAQAKVQHRSENGISNMAFVVTDENKNKTEIVTGQPQYVESKSNHEPTASSTNKAFQGLEQNDDDITWPMKANWILGNIVQVFAIVVTAVYFTALFPLIGKTNFIDINLHAVNTFLILVDTCITARPVRLFHVIHPLIYGGCYLIFSAVYWSFDHVKHVLYPGVLDWNYPGTTFIWVAGLSLVVIPSLQMVYFGFYRLRIYFSSDIR
jgi:hypothetical protein